MKPFTAVAVLVFSLISLLHLLRLIFQGDILFNGIVVPIWLSLFGFILPGFLAFMLWRESKQTGKRYIR